MARSIWEPISVSHISQFLGSAQPQRRSGFPLLLATYQEVLLGFHAVEQVMATFTSPTITFLPRFNYQEPTTDKSTEPGNDPRSNFSNLSMVGPRRAADEIGGILEVLLPDVIQQIPFSKKATLFWLCWVFCTELFLCDKWGYSLVVVRELLICVDFSCCRSTGSRRPGFSCCSVWSLEQRLSSWATWAQFV